MPFLAQLGQELILIVLEDRSVLSLLLSTAKLGPLSKVVSWGSETSNAFCDGRGKSETRKPHKREGKMKRLTKLTLYILGGI